MADRDELVKARDQMLAILDEKLKDMPEWRAIKAMDSAIAALRNSTAHQIGHQELGRRGGRQPSPDSYGNIGVALLQTADRPLATSEIVPLIAGRRGVDPVARKVVIQTALSKEERIVSVPWHGHRAWWLRDKEVPKESAANGAHP